MLKKERKGQRDLQKERNSDSWRNTDTEKEKQRKPGADRQRANKAIYKKTDRQAEWTDRLNVGRQTRKVTKRDRRGTEKLRFERAESRKTDGETNESDDKTKRETHTQEHNQDKTLRRKMTQRNDKEQ